MNKKIWISQLLAVMALVASYQCVAQEQSPSYEVLPAPVDAAPAVERGVIPSPTPTWNTTKATAVVMHPVPLRSRPMASATGDTIDAETRVRLESSTVNADGTWWFVTAAGIGGGWLLESEMGSPQR